MLGGNSPLTMVPGGNRLPLPGQGHHGPRVQHPEPKQVVVLQANAVHAPAEAALSVEQGVAFGGEDREVLYVPPGELGAGGGGGG